MQTKLVPIDPSNSSIDQKSYTHFVLYVIDQSNKRLTMLMYQNHDDVVTWDIHVFFILFKNGQV